MTEESTLEESLALKEKGNSSIKNGNFKEAALLYTQAIKLDPTNSSLYSNRSLAYLRLKHYSLSFQDALETIRLNPQWAKGYFRKAEVEAAVGLSEEAALSYTQTLKLQPQDVVSVLASIKKVTDEQKCKREAKDKLPWVCCCVGVIVGVILVILDYIFVEQESPKNPLIQVGTILTIACTSYGVAVHYIFIEENDARRQIHPPGFEDPDTGRQLWVIGCVCGVTIVFLDVTFVEIVGMRQNPMKIITLVTSIVGAGIGFNYISLLIKYFARSSDHDIIKVDCRLPFACGCVGATISLLGFVIDYTTSEEPLSMSPLLKGGVVFGVACLFWCVGSVYNMYETSYNKRMLIKNTEDKNSLSTSLWCAGLFIGICFICVDYTVANVIGLRENPLKCIGFTLSVAGSGFALGNLLTYLKSFEEQKQEDVTQDFQFVQEDNHVPEKISNKYTKAQARYRYKKGKM